jgi:hypothetical protein
MNNAILIEKTLSPQIAIASSSDKYLLFPCLCKDYFTLITSHWQSALSKMLVTAAVAVPQPSMVST